MTSLDLSQKDLARIVVLKRGQKNITACLRKMKQLQTNVVTPLLVETYAKPLKEKISVQARKSRGFHLHQTCIGSEPTFRNNGDSNTRCFAQHNEAVFQSTYGRNFENHDSGSPFVFWVAPLSWKFPKGTPLRKWIWIPKKNLYALEKS